MFVCSCKVFSKNTLQEGGETTQVRAMARPSMIYFNEKYSIVGSKQTLQRSLTIQDCDSVYC